MTIKIVHVFSIICFCLLTELWNEDRHFKLFEKLGIYLIQKLVNIWHITE